MKAEKELRHVKHPFPAVKDEECEILILGSVPSMKSVEYNFFYMHPRNRFWMVMSAVFGDDFVNADIARKKELLLKNRIALYDSIEECDIEGCSDNKIYNVIPADIPAIIESTNVVKIICNGSASYENLIKFHPDLAAITVKLPSTSPANASFSLERLISIWRENILH